MSVFKKNEIAKLNEKEQEISKQIDTNQEQVGVISK